MFDFEKEIGIKDQQELEADLDSALATEGSEIVNRSPFGVLWRTVRVCCVSVMLAFQRLLVTVARQCFWETASGAWLRLRAPEFGISDLDSKTDEQIRLEGKLKNAREGIWKAGVIYQVMVSEVTGVPVDYIYVDDQHPRGQGTVDIYLTDAAGLPAAELLEAARDFVITQGNRGIGDNVQINFPPLKNFDISLLVRLYSDRGDEAVIKETIQNVVGAKFRQNALYIEDLEPLRNVKRVHVQRDLIVSELERELNSLVLDVKEIILKIPEDSVSVGYELPVLNNLTVSFERESI